MADFNDFGLILQDFERLSDEINLFWRCSSPLRDLNHSYVEGLTAISPKVCTQEFDVITSNEKMAKVSVYLCPP